MSVRFQEHDAIALTNFIMFLKTKVCSLLEWCFIISIDTCWEWCQRTDVLYDQTKEFIIALANFVIS